MKPFFGAINKGLLVAAAAILGLSQASFAQSPNWAQVTGTNTPGYGGLMRFSQATPDGAYWIMTEGGGVHKSTDDGANWAAMNNGLGNLRIKAGVLNPGTSTNTVASTYKLFAGTFGGGVFKSIDGAANWTAINGGLGCSYVTTLRGVGTRLLAGTDCQSASGVYYSDPSTSWVLSTGIPTGARISSITQVNPNGSGLDYLLASTDVGIYKSTDIGATWTALPTNPNGPNGAYVYNVNWSYNSTATPALLLLAAVEGAGVFTSADQGATWVASNTGLPTNPVPMAGIGNDGSTNLFWISIDGAGVYQSTDRGANWSLLAGPDVLPAARNLSKVTTTTGSFLVANTLAGPYKSSDNGATWLKGGAGLPGGWTNNLKMDNVGTVYASAADGVYKFNGTQWSKMPSLPSMVHGHVKTRGATIYATTTNKGIYKFNATAWQAINTGLPTNLVGRNPKYVGDGVNANNAFLGLYGDGVYYTSDAGATWTARNTGLTGNALYVNSMDVYGSLVYISTDAGVYKSVDGGLNWAFAFAPKNAANQSLPTSQVAVDPLNNSTVFVAAFNTTALGATVPSNGLYKSVDAGATWSSLPGMATKMVHDVRIVGSTNDTVVAAAWDDGVIGGLFGSEDRGSNWMNVGNGLTTNLINSVMSTSTGAYAATRGAGLFSFVDTSSIYGEWKYFGTWVNGGNIGYGVGFGANDLNKTLTSIALSGGGQSTTAVYGADKSWHSDMQFGANMPPAANVYTAVITPVSGAAKTVSFSVRSSGFNTAAPTNIQPSAGANVTSTNPVFTWAAPANPPAGFTYSVNINPINGGGYIWGVNNLNATTVTYNGPALTPNTQYQVNVSTNEWDNATSTTYGAGRTETFCYQCTGTGGGGTTTGPNFDQLFIGRNSGIGTENFGLGVRYPRSAGDGMASYAIQCPNGKSASGTFGTSVSSGAGYEWYNVNLGLTQPATPFNCTSTVTYSGGTSNTVTLTVDKFADASAYPNTISLAANANISSFTSVTFTNPIAGAANTRVQSNLWAVDANGNLGQQLWFVGDTPSPMPYTGPTLTPNTHYQLAITTVEGTSAMHAAQVFIPFCYQCSSTGGDTVAPSVPTGVSAVLGTSGVPNISWAASTDNVGVTYYQVYRNGGAVGTPQGSSNTVWQDNQAVAGTTYTYAVAACDAAGNCSAASTGASVTMPSGTGVSLFDGAYAGTWSKNCPACGTQVSTGTFSGTLTNGVFSNMQFNLVSGDSGMLFDSGTVSTSGSIAGSGATPSQCSSSASTFTGQISNSTGSEVMSIAYSRLASGTCAAETGTITATRSGTGTGTGGTVSLVFGWNLMGNSVEVPIDVATTLNDKDKVTTVWKWLPGTPATATAAASPSGWAFYSPVLADGGAAYAASKGYSFLTTINAGEGFWVNAASAFTSPMPAGTPVKSQSFKPALSSPVVAGGAHALASGWSLLATGDTPTPAVFDAALSTLTSTPPAAGSSNVYVNLISMWAWSTTNGGGWYFWSPLLVNSGGLADYITSKNYLNFGATGTLAPGVGFWVNMP